MRRCDPERSTSVCQLAERLVCIAPVMLGDGVRLFDHPGGRHIKLERLTQSEARLATNLWFRVS
jgi:hypothetical protein